MTEIVHYEVHPVGRPTILTPEVRIKIEQAAAFDASVEEMAFYAGVSKPTLYRWLKDDEEFRDRIEELRLRPVLKARQELIDNIVGFDNALRYLERKKPKEFMPTQKIEHGGSVDLSHSLHNPQFKKNADELKTKYEADLRALYEQPEEIPSIPAEETPVVEAHEPTISNNPQGEATNL